MRRASQAAGALLGAAALLLGACGPGAGAGAPGALQVTVKAGALTAAEVTRVRVTVSGAGIAPDIVQDLVRLPGPPVRWRGTVAKIPAGAGRTVRADAYGASGALLYSGRASGVTIAPGATAAVLVVARQWAAPSPFANAAPRITALHASTAAPRAGGAVRLKVVASDPDAGDTLTYAWSAGAGSFDRTDAAAVVWTAPATGGSRTLAVVVRDGRGASVTARVTVAVAGPLPDVEARAFSITAIGNAVIIAGEICASGAEVTSTVRIFLHRATAPGCGAAGADLEAPVTLPAGSCLPFSLDLLGLTPGTYTGWLQVDADCKVAESDETNNTRNSTYKPGVDVWLEGFTGGVEAGTPFVGGEICHLGPAPATFELALWSDLRAAPTCSTPGGLRVRLTVAPATCLPFAVPVGPLASGSHTPAMLLDSACELAETDETNNGGRVTVVVP